MRDPEMLVNPQEALRLFEESTLFDMQQAYLLNEIYKRRTVKTPSSQEWEYTRLLSFLYYIGRIQGIREERSRRRRAHNQTCQ